MNVKATGKKVKIKGKALKDKKVKLTLKKKNGVSGFVVYQAKAKKKVKKGKFKIPAVSKGRSNTLPMAAATHRYVAKK